MGKVEAVQAMKQADLFKYQPLFEYQSRLSSSESDVKWLLIVYESFTRSSDALEELDFPEWDDE